VLLLVSKKVFAKPKWFIYLITKILKIKHAENCDFGNAWVPPTKQESNLNTLYCILYVKI